MKEVIILSLGTIGSIIMGALDYTGRIDVSNWANLIPLGISVLIVIVIHVGFDFLELIGDILEAIIK